MLSSRYALDQDQINALTDDQAYTLRLEIQDTMAHLGSIEHMLFVRKRKRDLELHPELALQSATQPPYTPVPPADLRAALSRAVDHLGADAIAAIQTLLTKGA